MDTMGTFALGQARPTMGPLGHAGLTIDTMAQWGRMLTFVKKFDISKILLMVFNR